jgi:hypothetical protein
MSSDYNLPSNKMARESRLLARRIGEAKEFTTTHGKIILNPMKRALKNKPYKCKEFQNILNDEMKTTIEILKGDKE